MRVPFAPKLTVLLMALGVSNAVSADAAPAAETQLAGRPRSPKTVRLNIVDDAIVGQIGSGPALEFSAHGGKSLRVRSLPVGPQGAVLAVDTESAAGRFTTLLGGSTASELLFSERTDLHGDPGERWARAVIVSPEGVSDPGVGVATLIEGVTACNAEPVPLALRAVDPKTLKLGAIARPAVLPLAPASLGALPTSALDASSAPLLRPTAVASSSMDPNIALTARPVLLVDGDTAGALTLTESEFAQLKWPRTAPAVEGIALWVTGKTARDGGRLILRMDGGRVFRVVVPKGTPGVRVTLPAPVETSCIALQGDGPRAVLELAEVAIFTALDRPDYVASLGSALVQDSPEAARAAAQLESMGTRGAAVVAARYAELSARGKQRALRILAHGAADPGVVTLLESAARDADLALSQAGVHALGDAGEPGRGVLRNLALEATPQGDLAVQELAGRGHAFAALVEALLAPGGIERVRLRDALASHGRRDKLGLDAALASTEGRPLDPSQRASLAIVAAQADRPAATGLIERALRDAAHFEDRYRLALAASRAGASEDIDAWLVDQSTQAEEWMQRAEAFAALRERAPEKAASLAPKIAGDAYPRVRAEAMGSLRKGQDDSLLRRTAKDDPWPQVRVAGAEALATRPELRADLVALLEDPSRKVRAAAIGGLAHQGARERWLDVQRHLVAADEWTEVKAAAIAFAESQCIGAAREPLVNVVRRGLRHEATEDEQALSGAALEALHNLGGAAADDALKLVEREGAPDPLKRRLQSLGPSHCTVK
ncbi:MAG: hypothetical protein RL385_4817 [Pseudomonadota bacterium]